MGHGDAVCDTGGGATGGDETRAAGFAYVVRPRSLLQKYIIRALLFLALALGYICPLCFHRKHAI